MWIIQSFFMSSMVFCDFLGMFEAIFPIPFHRTFKHSNRGFPVPQSSPRRVAGFFCNGEIGAPGLTKPSDDLAQREQVRERRWMDGWVFWFFFLETKKWWNRKVEVNVCLKKGSCIWSFYCILYISIFMFLFANIYEVVVSNLTKMLDDFTPAKAGELPYWVDTTWVKNGLDRRGEAHVSTRLHRCLRASWWWKFVCHGKMYKGLYQWKSRFAAVVFLYILRI